MYKKYNKILFKNSFWLLGSEFLNKIMMFLLTIILARYLGSEGYGQLSVSLSFTGLFVIIADFGISTVVIKDIARDKNKVKKYLDNFTFLKLVLYALTILALYIITPYLQKPYSIELLIYILALYMLISSAGEFIASVFRAYEKMEYIAISILIRGITLFILGSLFVFLDLGIFYIAFAYVFGALLSLIYLLYSVKKNIYDFSFDFDFIILIDIIKKGTPYALSLAFASVYLSIDSVLISYFLGEIELGYYSLAYGLTIVFYIIPSILSNVYLPQFSIYFKSDKLKLKLLFNLLLKKLILIIFPLIFVLYFFSNQIFLFFYGDEFTSSIIIFQALLIALFFKFFSFPYGFLLVATEKQNIRVIIQGISALFNLITNIIFIPKYGIMGAAATTVASEFFVLSLYYFKSRKELVL